jgi:hypothetical protein
MCRRRRRSADRIGLMSPGGNVVAAARPGRERPRSDSPPVSDFAVVISPSGTARHGIARRFEGAEHA